ncbi:MAG: hypothetical protein ACYCQK_01325 [Acidiferrobacteraceae bacterium]
MSDQTNATPAPENRLGACVDLTQSIVMRMPQFRPSDVAKQVEFDGVYSDLLSLFKAVTAVQAVDYAAIILAKDLSAQRADAALSAQKLRGEFDAAAIEAVKSSPFAARRN